VEELVLVVEELEDHIGVPPGNDETEPPMTIALFCNAEFWRMPCTPNADP
jgi:hypothetical protein